MKKTKKLRDPIAIASLFLPRDIRDWFVKSLRKPKVQYFDSIMAGSDWVILPLAFERYKVKGPFLDATFGKGRFWRRFRPDDLVGLDIGAGMVDNIRKDTEGLVARWNLRGNYEIMPFKDESFNTIMFDPPHMKRKNETQCSVYGIYNLDAFTGQFLPFAEEAFRVAKPGAVMITKVANELSRKRWNVGRMVLAAEQAGWVFSMSFSKNGAPVSGTRRSYNIEPGRIIVGSVFSKNR